MLLVWDMESPVKFRTNATVHDLELRFQLEEIYQADGKSITSKQFYSDLKEFLKKEGIKK